MNILNKIKSNKLSFSFEFFPPKELDQEQSFFKTLEFLVELNPSFVSMTYGAMGSNQERSFYMAKKLKDEYNLIVLEHFTCIGSSFYSVENFLDKLKKAEITNVFALRGDIPEDKQESEILHDFHYAVDLVKFIKSKHPDFIVGAAGYPEGHIELKGDKKKDLLYLKQKVDQGADFIITQLFFYNEYFYEFCDQAKKIGINIPIIPGIMPITNYKIIEKITKMCGVNIPKNVIDFFVNEELSIKEKNKFALDFLLKQCKDLTDNGISNLHFYTLNRSLVIKETCELLIQ